ncbi:MAG: WhiB family transcriptional regulator [Cellulomonadaceae bacterium]|jgi:WhiB family redox-sensing transcriptional regulator|nr:WhiB family transcriptional regulator [Cellulomonadaceae bacterium]
MTGRKVIERQRAWVNHAACRDSDPTLFFPDALRGGTKKAERICVHCPVIAECNTYATEGQEEGIWAGKRRYPSHKKSLR